MTQENFWWYITVGAPKEREDFLASLADLSGCIGAEMSESASSTESEVRSRFYFVCSSPLEHWNKVVTDLLLPWSEMRIVDMGRVENRAWHTKWKDAFPPKPVGSKLIVMAPWHDVEASEGRIPVRIDPGSAFGTGYHESTQIVLELLEDLVSEGARVADIGTGSGILFISALLLGAASATVRDLDPAVLDEVRKNMRFNGTDPAAVDLAVGNLLDGLTGQFDILTANILMEPLLDMVPRVRDVLSARGVAIFSGLLAKERDRFLDALHAAGLSEERELFSGEWWGVSARIHGAPSRG